MNRYFYIPLLVVLASCSIFGNSPVSQQGGGTGISENAPAIEQSPIKTIITPNTISQYGLFAVHSTPERDTVYFEIEDSLLGRHILVINRIAKIAARTGNHSGEEIGNYTIMFERGPHGTIQLKQYMLVAEADPSNPLMKAISAANANPVIAEYPILTLGKNGTSSVIDATSLLKSARSFLNTGKAEGISGTFKDHEIKSIRVFPENIEINISKNGMTTELDYVGYSIPTTFETHTSFLLLPKVPMQKRIFDPRVGFFEERYLEFGDSANVKPSSIGLIKRWRLEPKPEDWEKYMKGELVEPVKPIVFYIDPAVPKKWVKYMIEGINAWQVAFEKAGFKNAIWGREWTESDSLPIEDMRYSFIRYFASDVMNAFGPHVNDPRSGEIIHTNVCFYSNIMTILHDWYQVQVGPLDPRAQADIFDDDLMGRLIGYVVSHEVGHSIGLRHNFGASSKVPVDSLRSVSYLRTHGQSPSIMDYARHNYVAQPEDSIPTDLFISTIGEYDKWAIEWGYRLNNLSLYEDRKFLSKLTTERLTKNSGLEWGNGEERAHDPRNQTEDMGDDAVKASVLGLKNLKRVMDNLIKWNAKETDFNNYSRIYKAVRLQYRNYMNHVGTLIGGRYYTIQTDDSNEPLVNPVPREKQMEALEFIIRELINTPKWILQPDFLNKFQLPRTMDEIEDSQIMAIEFVITGETLRSILNAEERFGKDKTLTLDEVLDRMRNAIFGSWSENSVHSDVYLRGMQRRYVNNLFVILFEGNNPRYKGSDIIRIVTSEINKVRKILSDSQSKAADPVTESHIVSLGIRIDRLYSILKKAK